MAKKMKLKKKAKFSIGLIIFGIILIILGVKFYKGYLYKQTYEYKLLEINYSLDEAKILKKKLSNKELDNILTLEHNSDIVKLVNGKYFIYNNLDRYLEYLKDNNSEISKTIALVNVNQDRDHYEDVIKTNTDDNNLMLVNKYYYLDSEYAPSNLINVSSSYSYEGNSINEDVFNAFKDLFNKAKEEGHTIVINSSYRDYKSQKEVWDSRKNLYGSRKADAFAARAGHSEHQTGYAIDVADFYDKNDTFGETDSFLWMKENCYNFGFILRYPEDKEDITGYSYEPWHYRYVGEEAAKVIKDENITFDEYYAYYIENK